jgi:hypothetical protein
MALELRAVVNEDGIIEPEVIGSRMDPEEYAARAARIKIDDAAITALEAMGALLDDCYKAKVTDDCKGCPEHTVCKDMDAFVVRVCSQPVAAKCDICMGDARWKAESWMRSYPVYLCEEHMKSRIDQYKCFDRI